MIKREKPIRMTSIGGQALIEGVMMLGPHKGAMTVRTKDGTMTTETWDIAPRKWYQKVPFLRGIFNFVKQMISGYKYITRSAELSGMMDDDTDEEPSKFEKWLTEKLGDKLMTILMAIAMVIGVGLAVVLFLFVPTWIYTGIQALFGETDISAFRSLFEGILKIGIFVLYMWATSLMNDIKRTYEYHGAEHKTIATYEAGEELTVENVLKHRRFHPRCGTSFIFLALAISILVYSVVPINSEMFVTTLGVTPFLGDLLRIVCKLLLLPVVVGISYEIIRLAGRYDNILTRIISAPGLAMQRLTTREPDGSEIETAIASMKAVIPDNGDDAYGKK